MDAKSKESVNCIGRRGFIRSLFGLTTAVEARVAADAKNKFGDPTGEWFWSNIRAGHVGYPSGFSLRQHRPGSIMKIVAAAAFIEEGLVNPNETVDCSGGATVKHEHVVCQYPHGRLNLVHALGRSCNVYFATMAARLNGHIFGRYATNFGLNSPVAKRPLGIFPQSFPDDSLEYVLGLAEDLQPNALQLMRLSALVATKGHVPYMHSADDLDDPEPPFTLKLSDLAWQQIATGMQLCVREGTAKQLDPEDKLHIAAKTGTAQHGNRFQSWITGYFPAEEPQHAFCVWSPGGTSQDAAVPYAKKVLLSTSW